MNATLYFTEEQSDNYRLARRVAQIKGTSVSQEVATFLASYVLENDRLLRSIAETNKTKNSR